MRKALITLGIAALLAGCSTDVPTKPIEDREPKNIHVEVNATISLSDGQWVETEDGGCEAGPGDLEGFNYPKVTLLDQSDNLVIARDGSTPQISAGNLCTKTVQFDLRPKGSLDTVALQFGSYKTAPVEFEPEDGKLQMEIIIE